MVQSLTSCILIRVSIDSKDIRIAQKLSPPSHLQNKIPITIIFTIKSNEFSYLF